MTERGLLLFDLDGTLFRAETVTVPALQWTFRDYGLAVPSAAEILSFVGKPGSAFHAWIGELCPPQQVDEITVLVDRREVDLISETGELYPGVRRVLHELRSSVAQMALCTNGSSVYVNRVLEAHGLTCFFDRVRHRTSARDSKPGMVGELLARMPARPAIVIGDRADDIEAAHQNGLLAIAAAYGYGSEDEWQAAEARAGSPSDLLTLVPGLLRE